MHTRSQLLIHIARWIFPIESEPIENGAVVTFDGKIVDVGPVHQIQTKYLGKRIDHEDAVIIPGLINAHCHLELSPLKWRMSPGSNMVSWIRALIQARNQIDESEWAPAIEEAISQLVFEGIVAIADIGNFDHIIGIFSNNIDQYRIKALLFKELIAPLADADEARELIKTIEDTKPLRAIAAHSPYSVSPWAIKAIKEWDNKKGFPYSIHAAESKEEVEFLKTGRGPFRELLEERGHWPLNFELPRCSPIKYLKRLGVLDENTICVHCVNLEEEDIEILSRTKVHCCLCPRSNIFLGVGQAPVYDMWKAGIKLCLGTDSLASNDRLSIFAEMSSLSRISPSLDPFEILKAATFGGADALGMLERFGSILPGKSSRLLVLKNDYRRSQDVVDYLVHNAVYEISDSNCYWIS